MTMQCPEVHVVFATLPKPGKIPESIQTGYVFQHKHSTCLKKALEGVPSCALLVVQPPEGPFEEAIAAQRQHALVYFLEGTTLAGNGEPQGLPVLMPLAAGLRVACT